MQLIWSVKVKPIQKLTLTCSLCLTVFVITITIIRASGLEWQGKLDVLWNVYFQIVAAEVGLILVSMTAFRALFVSRAARKQHSPRLHPSLWTKSKYALKKLLNPIQWTLKHSGNISGSQKYGSTKEDFDGKLPNIPGATITGVRTFIDHEGDTTESRTDLSPHQTQAEANQDDWPLSRHTSISQIHEESTCYNQPKSGEPQINSSLQHKCAHCGQPTS